MALLPIEAHCESCKTTFAGQPKRSFLGFQKVKCPSCGRALVYPLTSRYRSIYWGLFIITVLAFFLRLSQGEIRFGWLGILALFVLIYDQRIGQRAAVIDYQKGEAETIKNDRLRFLLSTVYIHRGIKYYPAEALAVSVGSSLDATISEIEKGVLPGENIEDKYFVTASESDLDTVAKQLGIEHQNQTQI